MVSFPLATVFFFFKLQSFLRSEISNDFKVTLLLSVAYIPKESITRQQTKDTDCGLGSHVVKEQNSSKLYSKKAAFLEHWKCTRVSIALLKRAHSSKHFATVVTFIGILSKHTWSHCLQGLGIELVFLQYEDNHLLSHSCPICHSL